MKSHATQSASAKPAPAVLEIVCRTLDDKKADEVRVLRVGNKSSITDYLVIATGTSEPHLRALRVELEKAIDSSGTPIIGMDTGEAGSGWMVIDAFDVMVHVLTKENRERYSLENLWKDADEISVDALLGREKPATVSLIVAKKKQVPAKKPVAKAKKAASAKKAPARKATKPVAKAKKKSKK